MILTGCGAAKHQPTVIYRDSTRVEYRDRIVRDTVEYKLPVLVEKHVTDDTVSVIENEYAKSVAVVHDGKLSHDLRTLPAIIRIPVAVEVHDTTYIEKKAEVITETVEVERKLTFMQKAFIGAGKLATVLLVLAALFFVARFFLKGKLLH